MKKVHVLWSLFAILLLAANVNAIDFTNIANQAKEEAEKKAKEEAAKKLTLTAEDAIKEAYETPQPVPLPPPPPQAQPQYQQPQPQYQYPPQQYPPQQVQYKCECNCGNKADNFTAGERWGTWALNTLVPGLGSATIMNDWVGMSIQLGLTTLGVVFITALGEEEVSHESPAPARYCLDYDYYGNCLRYDSYSYSPTSNSSYTRKTGLIPVGIGMLGVNFLFNIARSNSYNKPNNNPSSRYSSTERGGFNLSVLNNRNGETMPYLMYKRIF